MVLLLGSLALLVRKYRAGRLYFGVLMHIRVHQDLFHIVWKGVVIESEENCKCTNGYHFVNEYSWVLITQKETAKQVKSESKERVVATTVAVTEIMDALEVDLVGVPTSSKTLPKRYKGLPEVGNPMSPDMEKVKSLKPSEVLSVTTLEYELKPVFDGVGMKANFLDLTSLKNMQSSISDLGKKYGREKQAEAVVTKLDKKVASIQKEVKGKKEPTVLILLGVPGSYLVATEHSYIGDLVKQLGGKNIVQGEQVEYLASNTEYLKKADPDIILRALMVCLMKL